MEISDSLVRLGDVLPQKLFIEFEQFTEFQRFNEVIKTFFVATFKDGECDIPVGNIWKVQHAGDLAMSMVASGREDLNVGILNLTEV